MLVSQFYFDLPKESIAQAPIQPKDQAKLLLVDDSLSDHIICQLPEILRAGDLLVFNDTKVIPAQLNLTQNGRHIQVTLVKQIATNQWQAFAKPARKLHVGETAFISDDFSCEVLNKQEGEVILKFNAEGATLSALIQQYGQMPLPPYIKRTIDAASQIASDKHDYQTIFANKEGAVAAPTAGLHFTHALMDGLAAKQINHTTVTLHVGMGTFLPVKVTDTQDHKMHAEYGIVTPETAALINQTKQQGGRVVCVGTTSLRLLESAADDQGVMHDFAGETSIFITPGYRFKIANLLLTNFHLPESTLFMLVCAFAGFDQMHAAYHYAIRQNYRFYSYGDACLLSCKDQ